MKTTILLSLIFLLTVACTPQISTPKFSAGEIGTTTTANPEATPTVAPTTIIPIPATPSSCSSGGSSLYRDPTYYVDAVNGNDSNNGSSESPWKTVTKAMSITAPVTIYFRDGEYGLLRETANPGRTAYLTLRAAPGSRPNLTGVYLSYAAKNAVFLRVVGFSLKPDHRDGGNIVYGKNLTDFEVLNNDITSIKYARANPDSPGNPYNFVGAHFENVDRVLVESNCITSVFRGIQVASSTDVTIRHNIITPQSSTGIQYLSLNHNVIIEENHIYGQAYVPYPEDPDAVFDPHASMISIRSGDLIVRNNIMHGLGSSSGMMFYLADVTGGMTSYSNITIENNLIYDAHNGQVLRMYNLGDNVIVRNNTIISQLRLDNTTCNGITNDARYRYNSGVAISSVAAGTNLSTFKFHNNIIVGIAAMADGIDEKNNIVWAYQVGGTFLSASPSGTSKIITSTYRGCGNHSNYFENNFFAEEISFLPKHGNKYTFNLDPLSEGINFGSSLYQTEKELIALDEYGFVDMANAPNRTASSHHVGAVGLLGN